MPGDESTILLVSMCGTPEEFLAAFRRYVDRHGLFVPTASPLPAAHRGHFAVTLIDGGVMIEGEADVVSASPRPSALYGRTGMVLAFTSVDAPSQDALTALDKAKLSLKSQSLAATLTARPSRLREPVTHPDVKLRSAASDRVIALAECVVVGDLAALIPSAPATKGASTPPRAGQRFVIPQIQPSAAPQAPHSTAVSLSSPTRPALSDLSARVTSGADLTGDATEVGPIIDEAALQPSGPTLTTPGVSAAPTPPEALAQAVGKGASGVFIEADLENTLGGPPPMPKVGSGPVAISTLTATPAHVAAPHGPSGQAQGHVAGYASSQPAARPSTRDLAAAAAGGSGAASDRSAAVAQPTAAAPRRPSMPVIPRTLTPSIPAIPRTLTPSIALRNEHSGSVTAPRGSTEAGVSSQPIRPPERIERMERMESMVERPSQATFRKTSIGIAAMHVEPAPAAPPVAAPLPPAGPRVATPGVDIAAVPQLIHDSMFASRDEIADITDDRTDDQSDDRSDDVAAASDARARSAIPVASDLQATRREGKPRSLPRAATPGMASPAPLPGMGRRVEAAPEMGRADAMRSGAMRTPEPALSSPASSGLRAPHAPGGSARPPSSPLAPAPDRSQMLPGRLGRSSAPMDVPVTDLRDEPFDAAQTATSSETDLDADLPTGRIDSGPTAAPRRVLTPPSQPTVPIRPGAAAAALAASRDSRTKLVAPEVVPHHDGNGARLAGAAPRRDSSRALGASLPDSSRHDRPVSVHTLSAAAAAPTSIEDASFATVPTSLPLHMPPPRAASAGIFPARLPADEEISVPTGPAEPLEFIVDDDATGEADEAPGADDTTGEADEAPGADDATGEADEAPDDAAEGDEEVDGEGDDAVDDGLDVEDDDLGQVPGVAPRAAAPQTDAPSTDAAARRSHPALPFSDPSSVSAPLNAVAGARPGLPFEGLSPEGAGGASATPPTGAQPEAPSAEQARPRSEESARHARARQVELGAALDAKIEIDPALYAESAIDRSFEDNFVLPGTTPRPWQEVPTPWNGQPGEPAATPPAAAYGYQPPYPGYDPAYPIAVSSGDETALVSAPDVRRSRTMVIIGSAILVLLAGFAIYLYLDRAGGTKTTPTAPVTGSGAITSPATPAQDQDQDQEPPRAAAQAPAGSNAATHDDKAAGSAADGDRSAGAPADSQATGAKDGTAGAGAAPPSDPGAVAGVPAIVPSGEPSVVPRAPGDPACKVDLKSQPAGATVVFDGKDLGTTPLTAPLPCQLVTLTFRKAGHPDTVKELTASTKAQTLSVVLKGAEIEIKVNTIPFAARIRVNNKEVGRSPISVMVPVGVPVVLSSTKDGRATSVKVTPTENNRSFTLDFKRARAPRKPESGGLEGV